MEIDKLIKLLDNNREVVSQKNDGLLVWPVIRFIVIQHLIDKANNLNSASSKVNHSIFELIKKIIYGIIKNPFFGPKKSVLIFSSSLSYIRTENNRYFNRITDYFFELDIENSWKIDEDYNPYCKRKYPAYSKFIISFYIELLTKITLFFGNEKSISHKVKIDIILESINSSLLSYHLKIDDYNIKTALLRAVNRMEYSYKVYNRLFKKKNIRKIIIEDGYYGLDKALIIKAATDNNIIIYEPQHGFINELHPSYNYGFEILNNVEFKEYYPNFFLSYGEYWSRSVNLMNQIINVGNPHLEISIQNVLNLEAEKRVLVIGSGVTIQETNDLLNKLLETLPKEYRLYYRPHPQERKDFLSRYSEAFRNNVYVDDEELYSSLAKSEIIIGELTTVIFEATILSKKVYLYYSSYTKAYYKEQLEYFNVLDLNNIEHIYTDGKSQKFKDYFWSTGWENSYMRLIS
jgi:hypothetical protein